MDKRIIIHLDDDKALWRNRKYIFFLKKKNSMKQTVSPSEISSLQPCGELQQKINKNDFFFFLNDSIMTIMIEREFVHYVQETDGTAESSYFPVGVLNDSDILLLF